VVAVAGLLHQVLAVQASAETEPLMAEPVGQHLQTPDRVVVVHTMEPEETAAPVSLSSKFHLRTMPHSHLV
jgi:hypothetical protein